SAARPPLVSKSLSAILPIAAFFLSVTTVALTALLPKHVGFDSELGVLCGIHYSLGKSPALDQYSSGNPSDLSSDFAVRDNWWAPGYQALPFVFHKAGLPWGRALSVCSATFLAIGLALWTTLFQLVTRSWQLTSICLIALVCCPYTQEF